MRQLLLLTGFALCATLGIAQECLPTNERIDCHPGPFSGDHRQQCEAMGCIYCNADPPDWNIPTCFLPKSYGYRVEGEPEDTGNGFRVTLKRATNISMFGSDSDTLTLEAFYQADYRLRLKITDGTPRFEVPLRVDPAQPSTGNRLYDVEFSNNPVFAFKVIRRATGTVIFDTSLGGLTFSDQFLQLSTRLPTKNLYGIGEVEQISFRHSFDRFPTYPLFAKDQAPQDYNNMYGVQPHYTVLEEDGNAHTVVFVNSNAQEFVVLPAPGLLHRTIGGIIDIYIFLGPTPENTVQQYTEAVGRTTIPPYWALGFQICKYGYNNIETMQAVVNRTAAALIPHDVQYGDIDIMDGNRDFTYSKERFAGLPEYIKELKAKGVKFMTILDPAIAIEAPGTYPAFDLGLQADIFLNHSDGTMFRGRVWPENDVAFPDFNKNATRDWWISLIKDFHNLLEWDALWIDMNEPITFGNGDAHKGCPTNKYNNPPYVPKIAGGYLPTLTVCMDIEDSMSMHYNTHSLYGWLESEPTVAGIHAALPGKRAYALSRSTYLGTGRWVSHWLGDNHSKWRDLKASVVGTLQFNQFGIPFVGPDICGHSGNVDEELCHRWHELGAFYPFSRNHNGNGYEDQDPAAPRFSPEVAETTRKTLEIRYTYLPYMYTLFFYHYTQGNTVFRALWHEFPNDLTARGVDTQFLLGPGFMVSPALEEGQRSVDAYFPDSRWFNLREGTEVNARGTTLTLNTPLDTIHLHLRGGVIYPTQEPALNTELARRNDIGIVVALDDNNSADGRMYNDDGDSRDPIESGKYYLVHHTYANGELISIVENNGYPRMAELKLDTIRILGAPKNLSTAEVNGRSLKLTRTASGEIQLKGLQLNPTENLRIKFN